MEPAALLRSNLVADACSHDCDSSKLVFKLVCCGSQRTAATVTGPGRRRLSRQLQILLLMRMQRCLALALTAVLAAQPAVAQKAAAAAAAQGEEHAGLQLAPGEEEALRQFKKSLKDQSSAFAISIRLSMAANRSINCDDHSRRA